MIHHDSFLPISLSPPFSSSSKLTASYQYRLLCCASALLQPGSSSPIVCSHPASTSGWPCSVSSVLRRPSTSFPTGVRLLSSPHLPTTVHVFCSASTLPADFPPHIVFGSPPSPPSTAGVPATLPCSSAHILISTTPCWPAWLCWWPTSSGSRLLSTSTDSDFLSAGFFSSPWSSSHLSCLRSVLHPYGSAAAAPTYPAITLPLRTPATQSSTASNFNGTEQPPASRTTGPSRAPAAASCSAWHAGRIPSSTKRWGHKK